jgi:WD40 repeat protein
MFGWQAVAEIQSRKLFSQNQMQPNILPPTLITEELAEITPKNINDIEEVYLFQQNEHIQFIAIAELEDDRSMLGVTKDGFLYKWTLNSSSTHSQSVFGIVDLTRQQMESFPANKLSAGISFNQNGEFVIVPSQLDSGGIYGLSIWDTKDFSLLYCEGDEQYCPGWPKSDYSLESLIIHPTRNLFLYSGEYLLSGWSGFNGYQTDPGDVLQGWTDEELSIIRMAIDFHGDYFAFADDGGNIQVVDVRIYKQDADRVPINDSFEINSKKLTDAKTTPEIIDLELDDTHSWLGWLTDQNVFLWSFQDYLSPLQFSAAVDDGNAICFDRTGQILAVATQTGIKILSTKTGTEIAYFPVGDVSTVYFSRDNRLLIWGDATGNVHIWGIK